MKKLQIINNLTAFALVLLFSNLSSIAQKIQVTKTEQPFTFKLTDGKDDQIIEPSAVETIDKNGKYLLVIDDKSEDASPLNLRIVNAADGKLIKAFKIPNAPDKPKWEAITKDEEYFYLIGSHAAKDADNAAKLAKRSHLYRFRLKMNEDPSKIEIDAAAPIIEFDIKSSLKDLQIYTDKPSEMNVKIEGLAIKTVCGKKYLIFGLREPSALVEVYSAELPTDPKDAIIKLSLKPYFRFDAKKTGDTTPYKLSSIEYAPNLNGFLVLTSSETTIKAENGKDKPVFHGNAIWYISDEQIKAAQPAKFSEGIKPIEAQKVSEFEVTMKAEGFCLMPTADKKITRLAIVFDNDTQDMKEAAPDNFIVGMMKFVELLQKSP